ncbi:13E12 repeat family protein [Mycobacterium hubeiense]|uniref:13E12 repeat family protein n=1 Tax=Mycobacterium hubeiense TaxID=1867256 RepID=UPI000C7E9717|nr:13E12 repeat family protein [Mycobacterium sp. QGD 101]
MAEFLTGQAARERFRALADVVDGAYAEMAALSSDGVGNDFRVELAERLETQERLNRGLMYRVFGEIADPPDETAMVPALKDRLWARLRIPPGEIKRRFKTAARLRPRRQISGPPTAPELALVAEALAGGRLGEDHLRVICTAMDKLPSCVSPQDRGEVQASLVREAVKNDAHIVRAAAGKIDEIFNPDGHFDEADRARRRGLNLGPQQRDGMSWLQGWIDPETRCYVEAASAAVRPGRHLPDGSTAEVPDERTPAQRCHDGLKLGLKAGLASGGLGSHRGHPVTVIATTTLAELNQAAHAVGNPDLPMPPPARTGGHTALPMRDLIRMATDAIHYLAVFDEHSGRPLYLGRQKRLATADQRIICYARDRGCTRPNCTEPGYHCEVHHDRDWAAGGPTDADHLFFACAPDHKRVTDGQLHTEVTDNGRLGWTDGTGPPEINHAHHPEELLRGDPDPPEGGKA